MSEEIAAPAPSVPAVARTFHLPQEFIPARRTSQTTDVAVVEKPAPGQPAHQAVESQPSTEREVEPDRLTDTRTGVTRSGTYSTEGLKVDETNRETFKAIGSIAAKIGLSQDQFREVGQWLNKREATFANDFHQFDAQGAAATRKQMQATWGDQFEGNVQRIKRSLSGLPFETALYNARLPDGRAIFNTPDALRWFSVATKLMEIEAIRMRSGRGTTPKDYKTMDSDTKNIEDQYREAIDFMGQHRREYDRSPDRQNDMTKLIEKLSSAGRLDAQGNLLPRE